MLGVNDLTVAIGPDSNPVDIVSGVSFSIGKGEVLGLVGESGCGKSMTSLAIMGLLPDPGPRVRAGRIELDGVDVIEFGAVAAGRGRPRQYRDDLPGADDLAQSGGPDRRADRRSGARPRRPLRRRRPRARARAS